MKLADFLEFFDSRTKINVFYYGNIEYTGTVADIPSSNTRNREVVPGMVIVEKGEICIFVEKVYPERNSDVIVRLKDNILPEDKVYIEKEIQGLMFKYGIEREGDFYYKKPKKIFEDMEPIMKFYISLSKPKFKKYIKMLGYVSHKEEDYRFENYY